MSRSRPLSVRSALAAAACAVGLTGCEAPLEPESRASSSPSATPESPATSPPTPAPSPSLTPTTAPKPTAPATPRPKPARARSGLVLGADMSWPQCPKGMGIPERQTQGRPLPIAGAEYVVVGLTNGPAFTPNPCLADQVAWLKQRKLMGAAYAVTSYPDPSTLRELGDNGPFDGSTRLGALRNVGYQQAVFNLATMQSAGMTTPLVWVDVEPVAVWEWSADKRANAAVVEGVVRGYQDSGMPIGFYSTPVLWDEVVGTGNLALRKPEWRAAGLTSRAEALRRCRPDWSFQGGVAILGQWVAEGRDHNVTCPGASAGMARWFHQF